jgi:UDP-glucose 4-epimerase
MSKILVTGGAGYIGSQTNLLLLEHGFETIVFDSLVKGHREVVPEESIFIQGDVRSRDDLDKVFTEYDIDGVIHFAADPAINADIPENTTPYYRNNFFGTLNLLEVMRDHEVKNIVFSSTAAVYGNPESLPIKETQSLLPLNLYGQTKLMAERVLEDFSRMYGINVIRLRYFNACGGDLQGRTGEWHEPETHLIPIILQVASGEREKMYLFGRDYNTKDGSCVRDYIHTVDLGRAHVMAMQKMLASDEVICRAFNVGTGDGYSNLEIIETVEKVTGKSILVEDAPRRPGDWDSAYADNTAIKEFLGWEPLHSDLETIISTAWNWVQRNS